MSAFFGRLIFVLMVVLYSWDFVFAQGLSDDSPNTIVKELPDHISLEVKIDGRVIPFSKSLISPEALSHFSSLGIVEQNSFLNNRKNILELLSKAIYYPGLAAGVGVVTKNKVISFFKPRVVEDLIFSKTIAESSDQIRFSFLQMVESALWNNIRLVQDSNEYGLHFNLGIIGLVGTLNKGAGGGLGLFMNFSYNKEQKALAFEIGFEHEAYHRSAPGVMNFALFWKAFPYLSHVNKDDFQGRTQGFTKYPPGVFGTTSIENRFYGLGYTDSPLGFPSIFATFMFYENKLSRTTLLRLSLSRSGVSMNSVVTEVVFEKIGKLKDFFKFKELAQATCSRQF